MSVHLSKTEGRRHLRIAKTVLGVAVLGNLLFGAVCTVGAAAPMGGTVHVFVTPGNGAGGTIVITGAIGDYGTTRNIDKNGKPDPNGNYGKVSLKKGTFEVDLTKLQTATNNLQPPVDPTTCAGYASVSEPITILDGTGLYKGIAGTLHITSTFAFVMPTFTSGAKKGQCNESDSAQPLAQYVTVSGSGMVHFG